MALPYCLTIFACQAIRTWPSDCTAADTSHSALRLPTWFMKTVANGCFTVADDNYYPHFRHVFVPVRDELVSSMHT